MIEGDTEGSMREPVLTLNEEQLVCLRSPLRSEILSLLMSDGPISVTDLGRSTGYPKKSLYYPLRKLIACGLAGPAEVSREGRRPEQLFDAKMDRVQIPAAISDLANQALVATMAVALREVERATEVSGLDVVCHRNVARLSEPDREELLRMLSAVSEFVRERTDLDAPAFSLTMALVPRVSSPRARNVPSDDVAF